MRRLPLHSVFFMLLFSGLHDFPADHLLAPSYDAAVEGDEALARWHTLLSLTLTLPLVLPLRARAFFWASVLMKRQSHPTKNVLSQNRSKNQILLSF